MALIPGAITSLLSEDQLKREGIELMGNKLTMRQQTIAEWDPYHGLKSIRMVDIKPYEDLQYELIQQGAAFAAISAEPVKALKTVMQWHKTLSYCGPEVIEQLK